MNARDQELADRLLSKLDEYQEKLTKLKEARVEMSFTKHEDFKAELDQRIAETEQLLAVMVKKIDRMFMAASPTYNKTPVEDWINLLDND